MRTVSCLVSLLLPLNHGYHLLLITRGFRYHNLDHLFFSPGFDLQEHHRTNGWVELCLQPHAITVIWTKFRLQLKKVGKITRPFRYDINQIPYDYTVEVRNRFKAVDLITRVPDELRTEVHDIVQETGIKTILKEKKC